MLSLFTSLKHHYLQLGLILAAAFAPPAFAGDIGLLVPAYIYPDWWNAPNDGWSQLSAAVGKVSVTAIANPASGPGQISDAGWSDRLIDYNTALKQLASAGGAAIGYVSTNYGARDLAAIEADILLYRDYYLVQGIFLDEMSSDPAKLPLYQELTDYIRALGLNTIIGNLGVAPVVGYASLGISLVAYENFGNAWSGAPTPGFGDSFAVLAHTTDEAGMLDIVNSAAAKGYDYVYVTDGIYVDQNSNPWGTLPSYWQAEVDAVMAANHTVVEPDIACLLAAGLLLLASNRRRTPISRRLPATNCTP